MNDSLIMSLLLGLGLSSAVGFRLFVPALVTSIAAYTDTIQLAESMQWMGSLPALVTFGVATVAEVFAYYIPFVDNALDVVATPAAVACGSLLMGSTIVEMDAFVKWPVAVIAGGGTAGIIKSSTSLIRLKSSGLTAGAGNPVLATAETGVSGVLSVTSVIIPILAALILVYIFLIIVKRKLKKRIINS